MKKTMILRLTAAIAAARNGTKTVLIEESGVLGGQATLGIVTPLDARKDLKGKPFGGILTEISEELEALGKTIGLVIRTQREDIFDLMYRV